MKIISQINSALASTAKIVVNLAAACAMFVVVSVLPDPALAQQAPPSSTAAQNDPVRATLSQFGSFFSHPKYGEVWTPTVTPPDWHPYAPCNWVNSKLGWYYDDSTDWGAIVHHYGRWTHDAQMGWIWIPGGEFSPGWVVWRTSQQWIGWAPMPPDEDMQTVSADAFNKDGSWIFQDIPAFERGCSGPAQVAPQDHISPLLTATTFVTEIEIIDGIAIYVLPPAIGGPVIDILFNFQPWAPAFFAQVLIDWNWMWNNLNAPGAPCPPGKQAGAGGNPPPGGGNAPQGGGNPPPGGGGGGGLPPVGGGGFATCPDGSLLPANGLCPVNVVATCANGLLPPNQCKNNVITCGAGQHAVGTSCVANVVCTPPATPDSSGIGCVSPDPPKKVAGGGCNGPDGAYAGCSGGGNSGPGGGGGAKAPGGSGCAKGTTFDDTSGTCKSDAPTQAANDQTCDMKITPAKVCVANNVTCGAPGQKPCAPGTLGPSHCQDGTWQYNCNFAGGIASSGGGAPSSSANGCSSGATVWKGNGTCDGGRLTHLVQSCGTGLKISENYCAADNVTCGAPGLWPCEPGKPVPYHCADNTWRYSCDLAGGVYATCGAGKHPKVGQRSVCEADVVCTPPQFSYGGESCVGTGYCGPLKHLDGYACLANTVACTPPQVLSNDKTYCMDTYADVHGPKPSPSPSNVTIIAPTCCAIIHPTYGPAYLVGTPTPRPTVAATGTPAPMATGRPVAIATGTPIPSATNRPLAVATATPTPMATYRPPPKESLPLAVIEKAKPDIGRAPTRPIEVISHGGGGQNTYAAKPIVTTNARPTVAMSNSAPQPYRAPPTAFAHPMPAPAVMRKPGFKP